MAYAYGPPRDPTAVLGRRFAAYAIDGLLALIVFSVALWLAKHQVYRNAPSDACAILRARHAAPAGGSYSVMCVSVGSRVVVWKSSAVAVAYGVAALVGLLNLLVLAAITGASVGKLLLGLRVVDEAGRKANVGRTLVRWLLLLLDGGIFLIGLITVLATKPHRRVGDLAAGTYVVAKQSVGTPIGVVGGAPYPGQYAPQYAPPPRVEPDFHGRPVPGWTPPGTAAPAPAAAPSPWGAPPPAPSWGSPPASSPPPPPSPSYPPSSPAAAPPPPPPPPPAPAPAQWSPPASPAPAPPAPTPAAPALPVTRPDPNAPVPAPEPKAEAWWDTAIPPDPPDAEEPQP